MKVLVVLILIVIILVWTTKRSVDLVEIPNFLTSEECDQIISRSTNLTESTVYTSKSDNIMDSRKSQQTWLYDSDPFIKGISDRVRGIHQGSQEDMQVVKYTAGGFFKPHYDVCDGTNEYCQRMNQRGIRMYTVLVYLNDGYQGGETVFPALNKSVKPEKGKAIVFTNVDPNGVIIRDSFHGGNPVISGEKWIANKWIYQQ